MPQRVYPVIQLDPSAAVDKPESVPLPPSLHHACTSPVEDEDNLSYDLHAYFLEDQENDFDFIPSRDRAKRASP